ncbi:unnamed protein product [Durusdinium trenchii]|uniref:Uncharacterized protein n=1 Tax=Durusdinium trenchii TaxID=1381693 RepID=A0ABP0SX42_9DINO
MWEPAKILLFALVTFSVAAFHEAGDFAGDTAKEMQSLSLEETLTSVVARATAAKRRSKAEIEQMKSACVKNFETVDAVGRIPATTEDDGREAWLLMACETVLMLVLRSIIPARHGCMWKET